MTIKRQFKIKFFRRSTQFLFVFQYLSTNLNDIYFSLCCHSPSQNEQNHEIMPQIPPSLSERKQAKFFNCQFPPQSSSLHLLRRKNKYACAHSGKPSENLVPSAFCVRHDTFCTENSLKLLKFEQFHFFQQ